MYVIVSLTTPPTDAAVLAAWRERLAGRGGPEDEAAAEAPAEPSPSGV